MRYVHDCDYLGDLGSMQPCDTEPTVVAEPEETHNYRLMFCASYSKSVGRGALPILLSSGVTIVSNDWRARDEDALSEATSDTSHRSLPGNGNVPIVPGTAPGCSVEEGVFDERYNDPALAPLTTKNTTNTYVHARVVAPRWLIDTSCGRDLVVEPCEAPFICQVISAESITFGTANWAISCEKPSPN